MPHVELPQAEFKVVMLGDTSAGKTSLVLRFAEGYYRDTPRSSTVGAFFITKRIQTSNGITCKIQIWDTAGQAQFRPMAPMYYRNAAAAIVCYDVTCAQSYITMTEWLDELHRNVPAGSIVLAIAPTKCDVVKQTAATESEGQQQQKFQDPAIPFHEAEALAQALGAIYVKTSAKNNYGVIDLFQQVAERVLRFRRQGDAGRQASIPVTPGAVAKSANGNLTGSGRSDKHESGLRNYHTPAENDNSVPGNGFNNDTYHFDSITGPGSETNKERRLKEDYIDDNSIKSQPGANKDLTMCDSNPLNCSGWNKDDLASSVVSCSLS